MSKTVEAKPNKPGRRGRKPGQKIVYDTRPGNVIYAEKANNTLRIMRRQFRKLQKLAGSRNAKPTPTQLESLYSFFEDEVLATQNAFAAKSVAPEPNDIISE